MEGQERATKPKMSKAERRALQEKQRAAKTASRAVEGQGAGASPTTAAPIGKPPQTSTQSLPAGLGKVPGQVGVSISTDVLRTAGKLYPL